MTGIVQSKYGTWQGPGVCAETFDSTPTVGNALFCFLFQPSGASITSSGWTRIEQAGTTSLDPVGVDLWTKVAGASESTTVTTAGSGGGVNARRMVLYEVDGTYDISDVVSNAPGTSPLTGPTLDPTTDPSLLLAAFTGQVATYAGDPTWTPQGSLVTDSFSRQPSARPVTWTGHQEIASGTVTPQLTTTALYAGRQTCSIGVIVTLVTTTPPTADFVADVTAGTEPLTVHFTDTSTNTPTSWSWNFGDGSTSTSQNPTHVYAASGNYTVSLTATNADGSDTETKTAYINVASDVGYDPPPPGRAILEIKATPPGSDRWDEANWDEAHWASTSWQDVTPYGIEVQIVWGSNRPEFGILSTPDAASWAVTFYDPTRVLDPANAESPYAGDIQPMLPVRLRHNETVVKQGYLESGSHRFSDGTGYWRVMDIQAVLANAVVPSDTTLSNTLFQRARDAISAAALSITVAPDPPGGDPALAPWTSEQRTAWEWISDAAQQVLWVPFVRNDNTLSFRAYQSPLSRGRSIGSPNLVDLQSIAMHNGLFSIVGALELVSEGTDTNRRELTPKPRYGTREYLRTDPTPNSGAWAQAVLNDRAGSGLRWEPGRVVPFTASETAYFATLEAIEQVSVAYPEADPAILFDGIIVGGQIHVIGKQNEVPIWDFTFSVAEIPLQPLTDDDDVSSYLSNDDDATDILYPDV